jgi:dipeptide/tripeptide permease
MSVYLVFTIVIIFAIAMVAVWLDDPAQGRRNTAVTLALLVVLAGLSYLFALAGEPQSVWLWRDVLGIAV